MPVKPDVRDLAWQMKASFLSPPVDLTVLQVEMGLSRFDAALCMAFSAAKGADEVTETQGRIPAIAVRVAMSNGLMRAGCPRYARRDDKRGQ